MELYVISPVQIETVQAVIEEELSRKGFLITDHLFKRIQGFCKQAADESQKQWKLNVNAKHKSLRNLNNLFS